MATYERFLTDLVAESTALRPVLEEHHEDNVGDLLPHLVLDDVRRRALEEMSGDQETVCRVLVGLQDALESDDPDAKDAIGRLSFLGDLSTGGEKGAEVIARLPPRLRALLEALKSGQ